MIQRLGTTKETRANSMRSLPIFAIRVEESKLHHPLFERKGQYAFMNADKLEFCALPTLEASGTNVTDMSRELSRLIKAYGHLYDFVLEEVDLLRMPPIC